MACSRSSSLLYLAGGGVAVLNVRPARPAGLDELRKGSHARILTKASKKMPFV